MKSVRLAGPQPFTQVPNEIFFNERLSNASKVLYSVLLMYAREKEECFPGQAKMGELLGLGERQLRRVLAELIEERLVEVERVGWGSGNAYTVYWPNERSKMSAMVEYEGPIQDIHDRNGGPIQDTGDRYKEEEVVLKNLNIPQDTSYPSAQTSQDILGAMIDEARLRGVEPTSRVKGHLSKCVKELFSDGTSAEAIVAGFKLMLDRGVVSPSLLGNFVMEAALPKVGPLRYGRGLTTEQILGR